MYMHVFAIRIAPYVLAVVMSAALSLMAAVTASAAEMSVVSSDTTTRYFELQAKVVYLEAWLLALQNGELTPAPTFLTVLDANTASVVGTLARDAQPDLFEVCGPLQKGTIDWGDGTTEALMGLGCSGDVHTFIEQHTYATSGSYQITITDGADRTHTRVVAVVVE